MHFDPRVLRHLPFFCHFLFRSERTKRNASGADWERITHIAGLFAPSTVWKSKYSRCFPSLPPAETGETHVLAWLQLCPQQPNRASMSPSAPGSSLAGDGVSPSAASWTPPSRPAVQKRAGSATRAVPGSGQTSRAIHSSARGCRFWEGAVKAPGQPAQGKDLCRWLDPLDRQVATTSAFPPDRTRHYTRGAVGPWYLRFMNIQSKSYPEAQNVGSQAESSKLSGVFFSAHRRPRRPFISRSLHPLAL